MEELLTGLTEEQRAAVEHVGSPLLIVAGAGTGKTTVLTRRIAYRILHHKAPGSAIMAVTFTEKAAAEITQRLERTVAHAVPDMWVGTFHSIGERILRQHGHHIGLPAHFRVLSESESWMFFRSNFEKFTLDYFRPRGNPTSLIAALLSHFSRCKDELISPEAYVQYAQNEILNTDTATEQLQLEHKKIHELASAYALYEKLLLDAGYLDFGSLLYYTYELFRLRPNILAEFQSQFTEILVDEFQDTNHAQYAIVKQVCDPRVPTAPLVTAVGDDNQSIYGFRGAVIENILQFTADFPNARSIVLVKNYRSKQAILDRAWQLIQQNNPHTLEAQLGINKKLIAMRPGDGVVTHTSFHTEHDENAGIAQKIQELHAGGVPWGEMAVLVRAHGHADLLRKKLSEKEIPLVVHGRSGLLNHPIVLQCMQILRVWYNMHDSAPLYSLLALPPLSLSSSTLSAVTHAAQKRCISLYDALKMIAVLGATEEEMRRIQQFLSRVDEIVANHAHASLRALLVHWLEVTGTMEYWQKEKEQGRLEEPFTALEAFLIFIEQFERTHEPATLDQFIKYHDDALLIGDEGIEQEMEISVDAVHIMSMHGAKGLEFTHVFIPSMIQQRFPTANRPDRIGLPPALLHHKNDEKSEHMLEERRLCYVALTRARDGLYMSSAQYYNESKTKRKHSRFIDEMGVTGIDVAPISAAEPPKEGVISVPTHARPIEPVPANTLSLSFSQLQSFLRCPLQYKYRYILSIPTPGSYAKSFGTTMHTTLQAWFTLIKEKRGAQQQDLFGSAQSIEAWEPSYEQLVDLYKEKWVDEWYENPQQKKEYWEKGRAILKAFYEKFEPFVSIPAAVEHSFKIQIGTCTFAGRIDRIDTTPEGAIIIDYKTGKPKTRLEREDKQQLLLYYLASQKDPALRHFGTARSLQYWYLEDLSIQEVEATNESILLFEGEIREATEAMRTSDFAATPDPRVCGSCDFRTICPFRKL